MDKLNLKNLTIDQFKSVSQPEIWTALSQIKGGSFYDCHCRIFKETGIWIEELVPVFQKLDAQLVRGK